MTAWNGCPYLACPKCDSCAVCMDYHGNFVAGCTDPCPYTRYHRLRDWWRREKPVTKVLTTIGLCVLGIPAILGFAVLGAMWRAWWLYPTWNWFIVPLGVPPIPSTGKTIERSIGPRCPRY
jgi:hypothetical protein